MKVFVALLLLSVAAVSCSEEPKNEEKKTPNVYIPQEVKDSNAQTPEEAAKVICDCRKELLKKYVPLLKEVYEQKIEEIADRDVAKAFRSGSLVGENFGRENQDCAKRIKSFITKVQQDTTLGPPLGRAVQECSKPITDKIDDVFRNYSKYMDKLGERQHAILEKLNK